jgi:Flp pilus assembly protein TadB
MRNDSSRDDPRTIWQNQPTEPSIMTLEKIRQKTKELHAKTRRALLRGMTVPLLVAGISGWVIAQLHGGPVLRAVFAFAIVWSLAGQYFLNRGMWSATLPGDAASSTGLESYRREVERRRYLSGRFLLWSLGPVVLAIATLIVPLLSLGIRKGMLLNMIPFLALVIIWIVSVFVIRMRDQRELQREIDELKDIERANR